MSESVQHPGNPTMHCNIIASKRMFSSSYKTPQNNPLMFIENRKRAISDTGDSGNVLVPRMHCESTIVMYNGKTHPCPSHNVQYVLFFISLMAFRGHQRVCVHAHGSMEGLWWKVFNIWKWEFWSWTHKKHKTETDMTDIHTVGTENRIRKIPKPDFIPSVEFFLSERHHSQSHLGDFIFHRMPFISSNLINKLFFVAPNLRIHAFKYHLQ